MDRDRHKDERAAEALAQGAEALGLRLDQAAIEGLLRYVDLLQEGSARMSLTTVRDADDIVRLHLLDSLALASCLPEEGGTLLDVGSGAGFPGAVCALACLGWQVTLVERVQKKAAFLLNLRRALGLRVEVLAQDLAQVRGRYDAVVSRAAIPPAEWVRVGPRLVGEGGSLWAMLSLQQEEPPPPPGFEKGMARTYDVGAGPRRVVSWRRQR